MKLNLGCGFTKLEGYVNVDVDESCTPDEVVDICKGFPWTDNLCDEIIFMHTIEHIEKKFHYFLLEEIHRVLNENGRLILGYPEFEKCAQNWISNYQGRRDFWEQTIFGRQSNKADFHVCAMHTPEVKDNLLSVGFTEITIKEEDHNPHYTLIKAIKTKPRITYEEHIKETIFK